MKNRGKAAPGEIIGICVWMVLIVLCLIYRDRITLDGVLSYTPKNPLLAILVLLAMFAVKSLSVFLYSGILYAASGVLFPLPVAVAVNLCGSTIMVTLPYLIGRARGTRALDWLAKKYPKLPRLQALRTGGDLLFSFVGRITIILPHDIVSLYMGAIHLDYLPYLFGSLLGVLPAVFTFPIMGMSVRERGTKEFVIALAIQLCYTFSGFLVYFFVRKKARRPRG